MILPDLGEKESRVPHPSAFFAEGWEANCHQCPIRPPSSGACIRKVRLPFILIAIRL